VKYVGLLALAKILPTHPKLVSEHRDIILKCIDDPDISIRLRALDLVVGMVGIIYNFRKLSMFIIIN